MKEAGGWLERLSSPLGGMVAAGVTPSDHTLVWEHCPFKKEL